MSAIQLIQICVCCARRRFFKDNCWSPWQEAYQDRKRVVEDGGEMVVCEKCKKVYGGNHVIERSQLR